MSLSSIRDVRRRGGKPAIVTLILGSKPEWLDDSAPDVVHVNERARPAAMDWTPLMGVWVIVHQFGLAKERALEVVAGLERAGAKLFGFTDESDSYALTAERRPAELLRIQKERSRLCRTTA